MFKRLTGLWLLRRFARDLGRVGDQLERQNALLARLADRFAPLPPVVDRDVVRGETGVDFVDSLDQYLAQQYLERIRRDTGHQPTEDEILSYLADEKTMDLHTRLTARDREVARQRSERDR
jgi:hypothetical protein